MGKLDNPSTALVGAMQAPGAVLNGYNEGNKNAISMADMLTALHRKQVENEVLDKTKTAMMFLKRAEAFKANPYIDMNTINGMPQPGKDSLNQTMTILPPKSGKAPGFGLNLNLATPAAADEEDDGDESEPDADTDDEAANMPAAPAVASPDADPSRAPAGDAAPSQILDLMNDDQFAQSLKGQPGQMMVNSNTLAGIKSAMTRDMNLQKIAAELVKGREKNSSLESRASAAAAAKAAAAGNKSTPDDIADRQAINQYEQIYGKEYIKFQNAKKMNMTQFVNDPDGPAAIENRNNLRNSLRTKAAIQRFDARYPAPAAAAQVPDKIVNGVTYKFDSASNTWKKQ
jgi:hypothetical protein